jgi:purine-binding chemotaxis protein CheW
LQNGLLIFQCHELACAFPLSAVREVVSMTLLWRPPGLPPVFEGFLNLRGTAVPIVRFARLFSLPESAPGMYTPLIILGGADGATGMLVDAVDRIIPTDRNAWRPVRAGHSFNQCLTAEVDVNGTVVHLLSPGQLLLESERHSMAEFQAMAQNRLANLETSRP